jgi:hypothetical protein
MYRCKLWLCFLGLLSIVIDSDPEDDLDVSQDRSSSLRNFGRPAHKPAPKSVSEPAM